MLPAYTMEQFFIDLNKSIECVLNFNNICKNITYKKLLLLSNPPICSLRNIFMHSDVSSIINPVKSYFFMPITNVSMFLYSFKSISS